MQGMIADQIAIKLRQSRFSLWRRIPKLMNLMFRLSFVRIVLPVNGIFLRIPGLCRTDNLPKLPSFSVKPFAARCFSRDDDPDRT